MASLAPFSPVADWVTKQTGDHCGNYVDLVSGAAAAVTRTTPKTIYDPNTGRIHDVPAGSLAVNPWSAYQAGGFGFAAVIEEARTNYATNSYGAASTAGVWDSWVVVKTATGTPVYTLDAGVYAAATAQRIQYTGVAGDSAGDKAVQFQCAFPAAGSFAAGEAASGSAHIKARAVTGISSALTIIAYDVANSYLGAVGTDSIPVTSNLVRRAISYASLPTGTSKAIIRLTATSIGTGDTLDITIDAVQLEKGAFATSYIPTTTAAVTRNADVVTVPTTGWSAAAGTIVGVTSDGPAASQGYLVSWGETGKHIGLRSNDAAPFGNPLVRYFDGSTAFTSTVVNSASAAYVAGSKWAAGATAVAYLNGSAGTASATLPAITLTQTTATIGNYVTSNVQHTGPIARLTVYATALTDAQLATAEMTSELLAGYRGGNMAAKLLAIGVL